MALVVRFHHVLADGIGGLAVLAALVDGAPAPPTSPPVTPRPSARALFLDAWSARIRALGRLRRGLWLVAAAVRELAGRPAPAARTSLMRPTGPRRRLAVVRIDLAAVHDAAHAGGGTVNDVVLAAVGGALGALLARRGEPVDRVVASVPVSARATTTTHQLGNQIGILPVPLPTQGAPQDRLVTVTRTMQERRSRATGASAVVLAPAFRGLAALGILRWFIDHQRVVDTFVTNVRGPEQRLAVAGHDVVDAFPVSLATGNVPVAFAVLSYAGTLAVTIVADPQVVADLDVLAGALDVELARLVGGACPE
jgi:WS/DGAT/MGAT family acyltransferase